MAGVVGDDRIERAVREREHLMAGAYVEPGRGLGAEIRVVDDVADDRRRAGDLAAGGMLPADAEVATPSAGENPPAPPPRKDRGR